MRIGSLFSGIGGLDLGLCDALPAARVAWLCEQDPFCQRVLAARHPGVPVYPDVCELGAKGGLEPAAIDLICGGFP